MNLLNLLAYRPFLDPLLTESYWILLPPLIVVIAVVYKTIRLADLDQLPRQATTLALQIGVFMVLAAAAIWLIVLLA